MLVDPDAFIWYVDQDQLLSPTAHAAITSANNDLLLSAASIWEVSIKVGLQKLTLLLPFRQWMNKAIADLSLTILPVNVDYADAQSQLQRHHGDPFDRLMIAQAQVEKLPIVSNDSIFDQYGIKRIW